MTKKELLDTYRNAVIELEELELQLNRLGTDGRPRGIISASTDRISRATNNASAAALQLADGLENLKSRKEKELAQLREQINPMLENIHDLRTQLIIHEYYVLGKTDEQISFSIAVSKSRVNQIRKEYLRAV